MCISACFYEVQFPTGFMFLHQSYQNNSRLQLHSVMLGHSVYSAHKDCFPLGTQFLQRCLCVSSLTIIRALVNCSVCSYLLFACEGTRKPLGLHLNNGHSLIHRFAYRRNVLQNLALYGRHGSDLDTIHCSSNAIKYALSSLAPHYMRTKWCNLQPSYK